MNVVKQRIAFAIMLCHAPNMAKRLIDYHGMVGERTTLVVGYEELGIETTGAKIMLKQSDWSSGS